MHRLLVLVLALVSGCAAASSSAVKTGEQRAPSEKCTVADKPGADSPSRFSFSVSATVYRLEIGDGTGPDSGLLLARAKQFYEALGVNASVVGNRADGTLCLSISDGYSSLNLFVQPVEGDIPNKRDAGEVPVRPARPPVRILPEIHAAWTLQVGPAAFEKAAGFPGAVRHGGPDEAPSLALTDPLGLRVRVVQAPG